MDIDKFTTIEELAARRDEITARLQELNEQYSGKRFADEARDEWSALNEERDEIDVTVDELKARDARIEDLVDKQATPKSDRMGFTPVIKKERLQGDSIYDLTAYRRDSSSEEEEYRMLRDGARKAIEVGSYGVQDKAKAQEAAEFVLRSAIDEKKVLPRQFLVTGSPLYERAFFKNLAGVPLTNDEARAMSMGTGAEGGYLLPFTLDPTIILTSDGVINPIRQIARVESITTNTWKGVTGTEGTAVYAAEKVEATDNSAALAQPVLDASKAHYFVPFTVELDQDWNQLRSELGRLVQESKDALEADKFLVGAGGSGVPEGVLVGVTAAATSSATASLTLADVYGLKDDVPPRFQAKGQFIGNGSTYSTIRQLNTYNTDIVSANSDRLIGYPARIWSNMDAPVAAGTILCFGDFSKYLIVDRVGMAAQIIPTLFGTASLFPTGESGFYALWRNSGTTLVPAAFEKLVAKS